MLISASSLSKKILPFYSREGFTLIEMLVTISLIAFLLSITSTSSGSGRKQFLLTTSQEQLRALISRAKFLSIGTTFGGTQPICGYGVRIDRDSKTGFLFRDLPTGANCPGDFRYSGDPREKITGFLNEMKLDSTLNFSESFDIVFIPPDPSTVLNGDPNLTEIEEIISIAGFDSRRIKINKAGLIDLVRR